MEHGIEGYSMLLVKPWLKYAKAHHNWGDNTFTITLEIIIVTFSTVKHVNVKSSTQPTNLDNEFDCEEGLS
jgi:hypothetical protein